MAVSLRASGVMPPRGGDDASMASRRRSGAVDAAAAMNHKGTPRDAPLVDVDFARPVGVQGLERLLEARRVQQEHQVLLAARLEEGYHFLILLDSSHNFALVQGPAFVFVDQLKTAPRGVLEVQRERLHFFRGRLGLGLARLGALRELVPQRRLDRVFPLIAINLAVDVLVQQRQGRLEARRHHVPIVFLKMLTKDFDAVEMRDYITHLEARLASLR